jgi:hypothetical protein
MPTETAACTTINLSYWESALTVRESYLRHHPESDFHILVVDAPPSHFAVPPGVRVTWGRDLPVANFQSLAMRYNAMELITSLKAPFIRQLLKEHQRVIHLDADVLVYSRLDDIFERLETAAAVLTPHILSPLPDHYQPDEPDLLLAGDHNSGFIGFSRRAETEGILPWLETRCREACYDEPARGLCTDQRWFNLMPCLFDGVHIERSPRFNVAYWNLHERKLSLENGTWRVNGLLPLGFFHFSGWNPSQLDMFTKHPSRHGFHNRPELRPLTEGYLESLKNQGWQSHSQRPYPFATFSNGHPISALIRHVYSISPYARTGDDPFNAAGFFYAYCREKNLLKPGPGRELSHNRWNTDHGDYRLRTIRGLFKLALLFLGPNAYWALLELLSSSTSVRSQHAIFFPETKR